MGHKFLGVLFTPKGFIIIAQGNALGKGVCVLSRPEGAHYQLDEFALSGLETFTGLVPQGVALGYNNMPFQGKQHTPKNLCPRAVVAVEKLFSKNPSPYETTMSTIENLAKEAVSNNAKIVSSQEPAIKIHGKSERPIYLRHTWGWTTCFVSVRDIPGTPAYLRQQGGRGSRTIRSLSNMRPSANLARWEGTLGFEGEHVALQMKGIVGTDIAVTIVGRLEE